MSKIRIINYGVGNIHSALKAFRLYEKDTKLSEDRDELMSADAIVMPGVGAFATGMKGLQDRNLIDVLREAHNQQKPILGICLGAQLLLSQSEEFGEHQGLDLIPGEVLHFPEIGKRIPHIGWNEIEEDQPWNSTALEGIGSSPEMYFVHSYYMKPESKEHSLATTQYGEFSFNSIVKNGNTIGCQFHPEKSAKAGLKIIENFVNLVAKQ